MSQENNAPFFAEQPENYATHVMLRAEFTGFETFTSLSSSTVQVLPFLDEIPTHLFPSVAPMDFFTFFSSNSISENV
jgi:hypothetical protein